MKCHEKENYLKNCKWNVRLSAEFSGRAAASTTSYAEVLPLTPRESETVWMEIWIPRSRPSWCMPNDVPPLRGSLSSITLTADLGGCVFPFYFQFMFFSMLNPLPNLPFIPLLGLPKGSLLTRKNSFLSAASRLARRSSQGSRGQMI